MHKQRNDVITCDLVCDLCEHFYLSRVFVRILTVLNVCVFRSKKGICTMHYLSCAIIDYTSRVRVVYKAGWGCRENSIKHLSRANQISLTGSLRCQFWHSSCLWAGPKSISALIPNHPNYDGLLLCYWQVFKKRRHFTVAIEDNIEWVHVPHDVKLF